jgi:hypothetical protein
LDRSYNLSLTQENAEGTSNAFNYVLNVEGSDSNETVMRMWFLDSGDYECMGVEGYDCIRPD